MSGLPPTHTRWKRNRKFGDVYGGRSQPKLAENIFKRVHSLARPNPGQELPILLRENPSRDFFFPISPEEALEAVNALPKRHTQGLTHIWFRRLPEYKFKSSQRTYAEYICGSGVQAVILYPWPRSMSETFSRKISNSLLNEFSRYGAEVIKKKGGSTIQWTMSALRRFYIQGLIFHEIGHHLDRRQRLWSKANQLAVEEFADQYAFHRTATATHVLNRLDKLQNIQSPE